MRYHNLILAANNKIIIIIIPIQSLRNVSISLNGVLKTAHFAFHWKFSQSFGLKPQTVIVEPKYKVII